MEAAKNKIK